MYLKTVRAFHIQAIMDMTFTFPPNGLVVFTGQNSNGKSIIVKTLHYLITGEIKRPRKRASLVDRLAAYGEITYTRSDDVVLTAHISKAANATYVKLEVPGQEPVTRFLADKSYTDLVYQFGWHYDPSTGVCLNIAEEEDALLFYKTPFKGNFSILETAATDMQARKVADNFAETIKTTRSSRDQWTKDLSTYYAAREALTFEDVDVLSKKLEKLQRLYDILSNVYIPTIPDIEPVPNIQYIQVYFPEIPDVRFPSIVDACINIPDILPVAEELKSLRAYKCPTCGRGFDCDCENTSHNGLS